jgi:hypothetical protein
MPTADQVKMRVLKMLSNHMSVRIDDDGDILTTHESAVCWVRVKEWGKATDEGMDVVIQVIAPILWDVKRTPALYEWVATEGQGFVFGHVACNSNSNASLTNLFFEHAILGDNVDEPEIVHSVFIMLTTANKLDDDLIGKFGGRKSISN